VKKVLLTSFLLVTVVWAGEISFEVRIDQNEVWIDDFNGYDVIHLDNGASAFNSGCPDIPALSFAWVLPQGASITEVSVEVLHELQLGDQININPVRVAVLGEDPGPFMPAEEIYLSDARFPSHYALDIKNGNKTGFRIGSFSYVPFRYNPLSGRLSLVTAAQVTLHYENDPYAHRLSLTERQIETAISGLENIVNNAEDLEIRAPYIVDGGKGPVWIVIADEDLESILQPLVDHRAATVGASAFVSLSWIYSNYSGWDTPEQIRNYLIDAFENQGLVYALIVGDFGETTRISKLVLGGGTLNSTADLYYSDLDGTWDENGNHLYGEITDWLDYLSDIYVGRFSSDVTSRITTMVEKTISYETTAPAGGWRETALLCGAGLWPEYGYWGSFVCDSIADRIPSSWTVHKLYENYSGHPNNQIALINSGVSYVGPQGHGYTSGTYWYYTPADMISSGNYTAMTNIDKLPIFHSIACLAGKLQNIACIAERLMFWAPGGAVAVMFNSDNGFGTPPNVGPSEWLEIHFANQLWTYNQNEIGVAQALAKDAFFNAPGASMKYWILQENNLLGDPALLYAAGQTGVEGSEPGAQPLLPSISIPAPNPVTSYCTIGYNTPTAGNATVSVFDPSGRLVKTLLDGYVSSGSGLVTWNGLADDGSSLPSGCYTVVITGSTGVASARFVLIQ